MKILKLMFLMTTSVSSAAYAQTASEDNSQLADIVVTAQKRAERLQDVPIAISAQSGDRLAASGISTVGGLGATVSGLQMNTFAGSVQPFLRGIGADANAPNLDASVATYIDGVYISWNKGVDLDLIGVDRIEVVKGPQGTLFGRNAVGGAINVITRTPTQDFAAYGEIGYGNYSSFKLGGYVEGGIAEGLSAGIYGTFYRRDLVTNYVVTTPFARSQTGDNVNRKALRAKLAYDSGPLKLVGSYEYSQSSDPDAAALRQIQPDALGFALGGTPVIQRYTQYTDRGQRSAPTTHMGSLRADYEMGWANLVSITAYRQTHNYGISDYDGTDAPVIAFFADQDYSKQWSQELQLLSPNESKVKWLAGVYGFRENTGYDVLHFYFPLISPVPQIDDKVNINVKSFAVFGQLTYPLTDALNLTVGGRWTKDIKRFKADETFIDLTGAALAPAETLQPLKKSWSKFTPKVTVDYKLGDTLLYATFSKGYKSGAYNSGGPRAPGPVNPETITAYEIGTKSDLFDRRVQFNLAGYYYQYKNLQTQIIGANSGATLFVNAAKAEIYGIDADFSAAVTSDLRLHGTASYIHSEYKNFPNFAGYLIQPGGNAPLSLNVSGNPVQRTPKWTLSGGADYKHEMADGSAFDASVSVYYNDGFSWDPSGTIRQSAYTTARGEIGYTLPGGHFRAKLWADNIFNEKYYNIRNLSAFGQVVNDSLPRMYGATLSYKY